MADAIALYCFVAVDKSDVSLGNPFTRHVVILQSLRRAANKKLFSRFSASLKLNQSNISVRPLPMPSNPITSEQMLNQLMNARWMELHQHARDNVSMENFIFNFAQKKIKSRRNKKSHLESFISEMCKGKQCLSKREYGCYVDDMERK